MPKDNVSSHLTQVSRTDREVTDDAWIKQMLLKEAVCTIATVYDDQPFINSNLFVYDEDQHTIYFHTAKKGRTRTNVEQSEKVCFTVFNMGRFLPAKVALEFSVEYASVVVFGKVTIIENEVEAINALQMLLDKYAPHLTAGVDYRRPIPEELKRTTVYRIKIGEWSGKKNEVAPDFPGAFSFRNKDTE